MNAREQALAYASPTFADLCDRVRQAKKAHIRAICALDAARARVKALELEEVCVGDDADLAQRALDDFIERECEVGE